MDYLRLVGMLRHLNMEQIEEFILLVESHAGHAGVTHWAVSMRIFGCGVFFVKLMRGDDCQTKTAFRAKQWFADNWPSDLEWPREISRPQIDVEKAVA